VLERGDQTYPAHAQEGAVNRHSKKIKNEMIKIEFCVFGKNLVFVKTSKFTKYKEKQTHPV